MNLPGKSIFYVSCGIALTAITVFVFCIANSASFPPLDSLLTSSSQRRYWSSAELSELRLALFSGLGIIASDSTFLCNSGGLRTRHSFPQERIQGTISSSAFSVILSSSVPSANSWIRWLRCQCRSRTSCAARPEKHKTIF